jgi:hypothetical protein
LWLRPEVTPTAQERRCTNKHDQRDQERNSSDDICVDRDRLS